jgi:hypothetical protein
MKKILSIFALSLVSISALADDGDGYRILSRTQTLSPGTSGYFVVKESKKKHFLMPQEAQSTQLQEHKMLEHR